MTETDNIKTNLLIKNQPISVGFLSYQIIEINDQLYRYDGECPMQKAEIKNIDDSEDDGSEE